MPPSLVNATTLTPPQQAFGRLADNNLRGLCELIIRYNLGMQEVWSSPLGLSPQDVLNAIGPGGTGAATQLQVATNIATCIAEQAALIGVVPGQQFNNAIVPDLFKMPDGYSLTPNNDGTVTVVSPAPAAQ